MEASDPDSVWRGLKYVGYSLLGLILAAGVVCVVTFIRVVPPNSAKIVDAITGNPIPGVNVGLQVQSNGLGHLLVLREKMSSSKDSGRFFHPPSIHNMKLLEDGRKYSIPVMESRMEIVSSRGMDIGQEELRETNRWPICLGPDGNGKPTYFPS